MKTDDSLRLELFDCGKEFRTPPLLVALAGILAVLFPICIWMVFFYAPIEKQMGFVQKIFYFHVPAAWIVLVSAPVMAVSSIAYLVKRSDRWDRLNDAAVELAILFGALLLISGPLWGRKAWGAYWVWDVRLTSSLVLVLTLVACKIVRSYAGHAAKQISAGLSVLAVLNAVFVYLSVELWRGTHPEKVVSKAGGLSPGMKSTFWLCVFTFLVAYVVMLWVRTRVGKLETALDRLHMKCVEAGLED